MAVPLKRVDERVLHPQHEDVVVEPVQALPSDPDVVEVANCERAPRRQLVIGLRRCQHKPDERNHEEDREHAQDPYAKRQHGVAPSTLPMWDGGLHASFQSKKAGPGQSRSRRGEPSQTRAWNGTSSASPPPTDRNPLTRPPPSRRSCTSLLPSTTTFPVPPPWDASTIRRKPSIALRGAATFRPSLPGRARRTTDARARGRRRSTRP